MRKEEVLSQIKTILDTCELSEYIKVSEKPFEISDYHMYDDDYLGMNDKKIIPFSSIKRISYYHGEYGPYTYTESYFKLIFELAGNYELWVEHNETLVYVLTICIHGETEDSYIDDYKDKKLFPIYLNRYNNEQSTRNTIISSLQLLYDFDKEIDCENLKLWVNEANTYMTTHESIDECEGILFSLVDAALWVNQTGSTYTFENLNLKQLVEQLIIKSKVYDYIKYRYDTWSDVFDENDLRNSENIILRLKQEIESSKE